MQDFGSNKGFVQLDMNFEQGTSNAVELLLRVNLAQFSCNQDGAIMPLQAKRLYVVIMSAAVSTRLWRYFSSAKLGISKIGRSSSSVSPNSGVESYSLKYLPSINAGPTVAAPLEGLENRTTSVECKVDSLKAKVDSLKVNVYLDHDVRLD
ncbi:hypothetical protein MP228_013050 [Amoeboaphelidium protococcarum]|nr:hypothetical protein MP228_013050 [Amoeboaphelidium protococcarum]